MKMTHRWEWHCTTCDGAGELASGMGCPDCCDHLDRDKGVCLNCNREIGR